MPKLFKPATSHQPSPAALTSEAPTNQQWMPEQTAHETPLQPEIYHPAMEPTAMPSDIPSQLYPELNHEPKMEYHPEPMSEEAETEEPQHHLEMMTPKEEEHLLESPLDTLELPAGDSSEASEPLPLSVQPEAPVFKPQPVVSQATYSSSTAPIPESKLVETLMTWTAPSRPHRKKNRSFYTTVAILIILIAMIALLAGEKMLVAVLFALMFLVYVMNFIEPGDIEYKLSTQGVTTDDHFYHWQELDSFWFEKKDGYTILHILTQLRFPGMLMIVLSPITDAEQVKRTVARFLPFHEIAPKSIIDKWAETLQKYFPLENK